MSTMAGRCAVEGRVGRPLTVAAQLGREFGVTTRAIKIIGVEKFLAMSNDARRIVTNESLRMSARRRDKKSEAGHRRSIGCGEVKGGALPEVSNGKSIADYMEEFARSAMPREAKKKSVPVKQPAVLKEFAPKQPVSAYEGRIARMCALAMKAGMAR